MPVVDNTTLVSLSLIKPLPACIARALGEAGESILDLLIATDTDLDCVGHYAHVWLAVSKTTIHVFNLDADGKIGEYRSISLAQVTSVRIDSRVGSGFLEVKCGGGFEEILRYSNRYSEKIAKVSGLLRGQINAGDAERVRQAAEREERREVVDSPHLKVHRGTVFFRFLVYTRSYWRYTLLATILVVFTILTLIFPQQLVKILIDHVFQENPGAPGWFLWFSGMFGLETRQEWLYALVALLAITTLFGSIVGVCREALAAWINNRLGYDLRADVFSRLEELEVRYHDKQPVGQLMTRCSQDIETLQAFINQLTSGFGFQFVLVIGVAVTMFSMNWYLALIACVPAPVVMLLTVVFTQRVTPMWRRYWSRRSDLNSALHAVLSGIRVVKSFAQEAREAERFSGISGRFRDIGLHVGMANALFYPAMGFVFQLGGYFIWLYGGAHILNPESASLSVGELIAFLGYLGMFYAPLNMLTQMSTWFTQFTTQAHRVFEVLDRVPEIHDHGDALETSLLGAVEFRQVTFGYDAHIPVLKSVSFSVAPGEMLGIVGHSGSGKSTTVSLLMRYYDPNEGQVCVDGIDLRDIRKHCLRRQIGLVAQDPFLFRGTVAENIAYGNGDAPKSAILDAALQANAHMFITRNPDGYDTRLGEHGTGLSGGERQRVAIARALVHDPRILVLDEATSSVDTLSEREIQKALEALSSNRTVIAIAHRLSTLRNCDRILVFEDGEIRESGSHEELVRLGGIYRKLVDTQTELSTGAIPLDGLHDTVRESDALATALGAPPPRNTVVPLIQYFDPGEVHLTGLPQGGMELIYRGAVHGPVRAYRCFPVSLPHEYIALWTGETALAHREVGMIRSLDRLNGPSARVLHGELDRRYFIHYIQRIRSIRPLKDNMAFLEWEVDSDKGRVRFITRRWERTSVMEGSEKGRIIHDVDENRYEILDLASLDDESRECFDSQIFW